MIVPIAGEYNNEEYIVCPSAPVTVTDLRDRMLTRAMVRPGSYAYRLVDDLHAAIFLQSLDLKSDYVTYFSMEYGSFGEYLHHRERFPSAVVDKLTAVFHASNGMYHFRAPYGYLSDADGLGRLTRLIEDLPGGVTS